MDYHRSMFLKNTKWKLVRVYLHRCACLLKRPNVFLRPMGTHKYQNRLKISRCLCGMTLQCIYVYICTGAIVRSMGTAKIPIAVRNISSFVWYYAPRCLCIYKHWWIFTIYGHHTNTDTNYKSRCVCVIRCTRAFLCLYTLVHLENL